MLIGIPSNSRTQSAWRSPTALTSIPMYSSEAIDAAAWEIAHPRAMDAQVGDLASIPEPRNF